MYVMKILLFIFFLISGFYNLYLCMRVCEDFLEFKFIIGVFSWTLSFLICLDIWFY